MYADLSKTSYPNLSKTVFAIFMVLVPILLLNMLIAMMGNTYAHVIEQSEKEWVKQWAKIVVSLERAVSSEDAHKYLQEYSIKLGPGDDPNDPASEQRGVMVIKSKSKTRARQRKGAVANWKRVGKVTIAELKKRGMSGEELRRIMWGRASFSTPVRASPTLMQPVSAVPGAFGEALSAAFDVMTFSTDTPQQPTMANGGPVKSLQQPVKTTAVTTTTVTTTTAKAATTTKSSLDQKIGGKVPPPPVKKSATVSAIVPSTSQQPSEDVHPSSEDPLLDLMIAEAGKADDELLRRLARSARIAGESAVAAAAAAKSDIDQLNRLALGGLGLAAAQPVVGAAAAAATTTKKRKQYLVESSDNDICANEGQLGLEARLRRIRSASSRRKSGQQQRSMDASSLSSLDNDTSGYRPLVNEPDVTATQTLQPTTAPSGREDNKNGKQRKRPKTARNRVAPAEHSSPAAVAPPPPTITSTTTAKPEVETADPLEPWSTRGIKDMNAILAWKEEAATDSP